MIKKTFVAYAFTCALFLTSIASGALINNGDGTVTDNTTGLMWLEESPGTFSWESAIDYCETLEAAGYSDWRMPNRNELNSLTVTNIYDPAIDTGFFPDTYSEYYWSSTSDVTFPDEVWCVNFKFGTVYSRSKTYRYYVRPVRKGPSLIYLPHITGEFSDWKDYLIVDNAGASSSSFTLTLYDDSEVLQTKTYSVAPWCEMSIDLKSLEDTAECATLLPSSSLMNFRLLQENINGGGIAEFNLTDRLDSSIGFFYDYSNPDITWKGLALTNFGNAPATVTLSAYGSCEKTGSVKIAVGAFSRIIGLYSEWFPELDLNTTTSITAESSASTLSGIAVSGTPDNSLLLFTKAVPLSGTASQTYIPHITGGHKTWQDTLQINNTGEDTGSVNLTLYSKGETVYSNTHYIAASCESGIDLKSLSDTADSGLLTFTNPDLTFRLTQKADAGGITQFNLTDALSATLGFFFTDTVSSPAQWKGIAFTNFSNAPLEVSLKAYGGCELLGKADITIEANEKLSGIHAEWFPDLDVSQVKKIIALTSEPFLSGIAVSGNLDSSRILFTTAVGLDSDFTD